MGAVYILSYDWGDHLDFSFNSSYGQSGKTLKIKSVLIVCFLRNKKTQKISELETAAKIWGLQQADIFFL